MFVFSLIGAVITYATNEKASFYDSFEINKEQSYVIEEQKQINIKSTSADIRFFLTENDEIKVKYHGEIKCMFCTVDAELQSSNTDDKIEFNAKFKNFGMFFKSNVKMDVYLPNDYSHDLVLNGVSSDINMENLTLNNLSIETVSGDIHLKDITVYEHHVKSVSGDISLRNIVVETDLSLKSVSGDIEGDNITASLNFDTSSGDIELTNFAGDITGETVSGDIDLHNSASEFKMDLSSISGEVYIDLSNDSNFNFIIKTVSGDITIKFDYLVNSSANKEHHKEGKVGESNNMININTTSGDVRIS